MERRIKDPCKTRNDLRINIEGVKPDDRLDMELLSELETLFRRGYKARIVAAHLEFLITRENYLKHCEEASVEPTYIPCYANGVLDETQRLTDGLLKLLNIFPNEGETGLSPQLGRREFKKGKRSAKKPLTQQDLDVSAEKPVVATGGRKDSYQSIEFNLNFDTTRSSGRSLRSRAVTEPEEEEEEEEIVFHPRARSTPKIPDSSLEVTDLDDDEIPELEPDVEILNLSSQTESLKERSQQLASSARQLREYYEGFRADAQADEEEADVEETTPKTVARDIEAALDNQGGSGILAKKDLDQKFKPIKMARELTGLRGKETSVLERALSEQRALKGNSTLELETAAQRLNIGTSSNQSSRSSAPVTRVRVPTTQRVAYPDAVFDPEIEKLVGKLSEEAKKVWDEKRAKAIRTSPLGNSTVQISAGKGKESFLVKEILRKSDDIFGKGFPVMDPKARHGRQHNLQTYEHFLSAVRPMASEDLIRSTLHMERLASPLNHAVIDGDTLDIIYGVPRAWALGDKHLKFVPMGRVVMLHCDRYVLDLVIKTTGAEDEILLQAGKKKVRKEVLDYFRRKICEAGMIFDLGLNH